MPFRVFTLPFDPATGTFPEDDLNRFCIGKRVLSHKAEFFNLNGSPYWTVLLEYEPLVEPAPAKVKIDLTPEQLVLFEQLRKWRREKADEQGTPVFIISNNRILKKIAIGKPDTMEGLKSIKGFGQAKVGRYGQQILDIVRAFTDTKKP